MQKIKDFSSPTWNSFQTSYTECLKKLLQSDVHNSKQQNKTYFYTYMLAIVVLNKHTSKNAICGSQKGGTSQKIVFQKLHGNKRFCVSNSNIFRLYIKDYAQALQLDVNN